MSFLEELWSRNLGNLLMSPLRPLEFVAALMVMSLARLAVGMIPATILAIAFFASTSRGSASASWPSSPSW